MMNLGAPPYGVVLQVEGTGLTDGTSRRLLTRLAHPDGYEFTAIPVVAFLKQYGEVRTAGLHLMGHLCDPIRLVADMQQMGIKATEVLE
jgi:saccharopine dehydrogenase (NAD+, L-lysine-forming)